MRFFRSSAVLIAIFVGSLGFAPAAHAWWNDGWQFRKEITLDLTPAGADIAGSPTEVPVLVRLSLGNFGYFGDTKPDGSDLRFVASDDKTELKFHVERYDSQAQMAFLWVQVPRLTGGANTDKIFLYYGNSEAQGGSNAAAPYDAAQALVYHFGAPAGSPQDATSSKIEPATFNAEVKPASLINAGARFTGGQTISIPASTAMRLVPNRGMTISAWIRIEGEQQNAYVASLQEQSRELTLGINGRQVFARYTGDAQPITVTQTNGDLSTGEWHHVAMRVGDGKLALFIDGAEAGTADVSLQDMGGTLTIGGAAQGAINFLSAELDELQVSTIARSPEWIKAAARSQGVVAPLVVYGGDAQKEGGESQSYFTSTLRNVTIDGWIIIGILAVMFIASLAIMAGKTLYLNRVVKGNAKFLGEFRKSSEDPAALERREGGKHSDEEESAFEEGTQSQLMSAFTSSGDTFGISTLWRLYHHGMRETMKRLEGQTASAARVRTLSPQSIEAIRATMDASLTRMTQQLNSQMVWLTISIAGGPFLGLLGTVVGVMITFAAIAATGDVNINAIAPGTAAALVATVAGLGVAIPCLFGYNYLATRVREITADMRVFVDEFVTRIAETYS
jgi:biopolymer transport protein ExbB